MAASSSGGSPTASSTSTRGRLPSESPSTPTSLRYGPAKWWPSDTPARRSPWHPATPRSSFGSWRPAAGPKVTPTSLDPRMGPRPHDSSIAAGPSRVREPVIILGAPRSGTTLLASILSAHPRVTVVGEPRLVWRYGNDRRSDELRPEHARPDVVDHIHRHFAAALPAGGGARLVEKTPANAVR